MIITISRKALGNMLPQTSVLNLPSGDLEGAVLTVQQLIGPDKADKEGFSDSPDENNRMRVKLSSNLNPGKQLIIGVSQLLRFELGADELTPDQIAAGVTQPKKTLADHLNETAVEDGCVFPESFIVRSVENKIVEINSKKYVAYPAYMYEEMDTRTEELRKSYKSLVDNGKVPQNSAGTGPVTEREFVGQAYADYQFLLKLPAGKLSERYSGAEPIKTFKIFIQ